MGLAQGSKPQYSLRLILMESVAKADSAMPGKIVLTNITNHDIEIYGDKSRQAFPSGFKFAVQEDQGAALQLRDDAVLISSGGYATVKPNETFEFEFELKNLYVIPPGVYTVTAWRYADNTHTVIRTNSVKMTVTK